MPRPKNQNIDQMIGDRLKLLRLKRGLSQQKMGAAIDVTFQQYQKYEHGVTRLSPFALYKYAQLLEVSIDYFFTDNSIKESIDPLKEDFTPPLKAANNVSDNELLKLVGYYCKIKENTTRKSILNLLSSLK